MRFSHSVFYLKSLHMQKIWIIHIWAIVLLCACFITYYRMQLLYFWKRGKTHFLLWVLLRWPSAPFIITRMPHLTSPLFLDQQLFLLPLFPLESHSSSLVLVGNPFPASVFDRKHAGLEVHWWNMDTMNPDMRYENQRTLMSKQRRFLFPPEDWTPMLSIALIFN